MSEPLIILITGLPCTGKTTLGYKLAKRYSLPFVHKDGIKELLFEIDTTDFAAIDYSGLYAALDQRLAARSRHSAGNHPGCPRRR